VEEKVGGHGRQSTQWRIASIVAGVLLVWFAIDNSSSVNVHFWIHTVSAPLIIVIVLASVLGALIIALWKRSRGPS